MIETLPYRLLSRLQESESGCLLWQGGRTGNGYGLIYTHSEERQPRNMLTHRAAWLVKHGSLPDELNVLHECDTPLCCNPNHLFLGTQADNMLDKSIKGRALPGPVTDQEWWTDERRKTHAETLTNGNRARRKARGISESEKYCPCCRLVLPKTAFAANKARHDGLRPRCRSCPRYGTKLEVRLAVQARR